MQKIDKKITLILKLNAKIKRLELFLISGENAPKFMRNDYLKAEINKNILTNVLVNMNYLNY